MPRIDLADANDLERWADRLESRSLLPSLIRRLVTATGKGLSRLSMRTGEGVQYAGWDGKVIADGADLHVPVGVSVWEMGTNARVSRKASDDYRKRSAEPEGVDPAETTFVFVTPRRWPGKDRWIAEQNDEGVWRNVRVYDADDLEHWLERAPGVHAWFSVHLGKDPNEAESLETWWEMWSGETVPPIPPQLLLSGRAAAVDKLRAFVQSDPAVHTLATDSQEEAVAFVAAALHHEMGHVDVLGRAMIVRRPSAWRRLVVSEQPLIFLPLFDGVNVATALRRGHHVIVPVGREIGIEAQYELPRLHRDGIEAALKEAGLPEGRASKYATLGRRNLLSMRRSMAVSPAVQTPVWSKPVHARDVLPAVLAGRWTDSQGPDREAIAQLAGQPYDDVVANLTRWANTSDPPVRRIGDVWLVAAKQDAWTLLVRSILPDDLRRFRDVAIRVLGSDDPALGLGPNERLMAPVLGRSRPYSSHLIEGVADTLAMMGTLSDTVPLAGGRRSEDEAARIVRELLETANADQSARRWSILSGVLPLLAEAAPEVFLREVDAGLNGDELLFGVFQDREELGYAPLFGGASPHTGLLWALETIAWNPNYITQATLALARLSAIDPGGRLANRPIHSLRNIHVLWVRGTAATLDERLNALDVVRNQVPDTAWTLLLRLIPSGHDSASPPHGPTWRDWMPDDTGRVLRADLFRGVDAVCERVLADVGSDAERWADVVGRFANFPPPYRARIVEMIREFDPQTWSDEKRRTITETARNLIAHHRGYPDADWSLPPAELDRLETACSRLRPSSSTQRHTWLFLRGGINSFRDRGDYQQQNEALHEAQVAAVAEVYAEGGVDILFEWAQQLDISVGPRWLGRALGDAGFSADDEEVVLSALSSEDESRCQLAIGFVASRVTQAGTRWLTWAREIIAGHPDWSPEHKAQFLQVLPAVPEVWNLAVAEGTDVDEAYWIRSQHNLPVRGEDSLRAAQKLLEHRCPHSAVEVLDINAETTPDGPPDDLVAAVLGASARTQSPVKLDHMFAYHVGRLLDRLAEHVFDEKRLAELEWMYLPIFRYEKRRSPVLHGALSKNPADFVEVISVVYRAEGEEPRDLSDDEHARAMTALDLLAAWRDVPGTREDGTVDRDALFIWVTEARRQLAETGRLRPGDRHIGQVLRYGPHPEGDRWPCEEIRDLVEAIASEDLEAGIRLEVYNSRGTTTRGVTEGGAQERELATRYEQYARSASEGWPRTAAMLRGIARSFADDARRHDLDADLAQDLWR